MTAVQEVGPTFSMRYVALHVPVAGVLRHPGGWEIRVHQEGVRIWTQPFSLVPAAVGATPSALRSPAPAVEVLDPGPPHG
jgi:hypothetical protein